MAELSPKNTANCAAAEVVFAHIGSWLSTMTVAPLSSPRNCTLLRMTLWASPIQSARWSSDVWRTFATAVGMMMNGLVSRPPGISLSALMHATR